MQTLTEQKDFRNHTEILKRFDNPKELVFNKTAKKSDEDTIVPRTDSSATEHPTSVSKIWITMQLHLFIIYTTQPAIS